MSGAADAFADYVEFDGDEDIDPTEYEHVTYRFDPDTFEPPEDHEYRGEGLRSVEDGAELADLNGHIEFVDGVRKEPADGGRADPTPPSQRPDAYITPDDVAREAGVDGIGQVGSDSKKAHHVYTLIQERPKDRFIATPGNEEVFWFNGGIWHGGDEGETRLGRVALEALGDQYAKNTLSELVEQVYLRDGVNRDALGRPRRTVATPDGLLDLETRELRALRPNHYALNRIAVAPDPAAEFDASRFARFLAESVPDPDARARLQEYAGYCLLPGQPFKKALFLVGPTDSGKGTFLKAIKSVLGTENVANQPLKKLVDSRWGLDKIFGKMANFNNEVSPGGLKDIEMFKKMTGGEDTVTAESKGQPTYDFTVTQKFVFATNQFPRVPHADDAFFNRCLFVEFPNSVAEADKDTDLLDKLRDEKAVILTWMLDGLERLLANGQFTAERSIEDKRGLTKSFGSPVEQFAHECLKITGDSEDRVHKSGLYSAFARFCDYHEFGETPVQATFTRRLKSRGGVGDGQSRPVGDKLGPDASDKPEVFTGLRVIERPLAECQAEIPATVYSDADDYELERPDALTGFRDTR